MTAKQGKLTIAIIALSMIAIAMVTLMPKAEAGSNPLDDQLYAVLNYHGFTGRVGLSVERRLGRKIDAQLADLGRLAFHDTLLGLNNDNSCAGCHAANRGFGDTQSIAIGIGNNNVVGPGRTGPRNQRRTPMVLNNVFYPALMWNSRFAAMSGNPFDNSSGFSFPAPESFSLSNLPHLLTAQGFIPPTERVEMAGFHPSVPATNDGIRLAVIDRLNGNAEYRKLFAKSFPEVKRGAPITYEMLARAIAEFEFTLVFADAPIDKFARGQKNAMTDDEKRGALIFFVSANCVSCHAVSGDSNEMFSDFKMHVAGIPQILPKVRNVVFDGPRANEDFGLEQITGNSSDRYAFRTSPLRNLTLQPAFFHNGAFTRLEDAVRYHLNAFGSSAGYNPATAGIAADLSGPRGPMAPVIARLDPALTTPVTLSSNEFRQLIGFLRNGLQDPKANSRDLRKLIPARVPSGKPLHVFQ
jgi:cytochrome c peroxidase